MVGKRMQFNEHTFWMGVNTVLKIFDVADYFLSKVDVDAGETITHLKLQKIMYYAQAWHLTLNGERLFDEHFEAWAHGPVNPRLFQAFRDYGYAPIPFPEDFDISKFDDDEVEFLDEIWDLYGRYDAKYLEKLTHKEKPWKEARRGLPEGAYCTNIIKEDTMVAYYGSLLEDE